MSQPLGKTQVSLWVYDYILEKYQSLAQDRQIGINNIMGEVLRSQFDENVRFEYPAVAIDQKTEKHCYPYSTPEYAERMTSSKVHSDAMDAYRKGAREGWEMAMTLIQMRENKL